MSFICFSGQGVGQGRLYQKSGHDPERNLPPDLPQGKSDHSQGQDLGQKHLIGRGHDHLGQGAGLPGPGHLDQDRLDQGQEPLDHEPDPALQDRDHGQDHGSFLGQGREAGLVLGHHDVPTPEVRHQDIGPAHHPGTDPDPGHQGETAGLQNTEAGQGHLILPMVGGQGHLHHRRTEEEGAGPRRGRGGAGGEGGATHPRGSNQAAMASHQRIPFQGNVFKMNLLLVKFSSVCILHLKFSITVKDIDVLQKMASCQKLFKSS